MNGAISWSPTTIADGEVNPAPVCRWRSHSKFVSELIGGEQSGQANANAQRSARVRVHADAVPARVTGRIYGSWPRTKNT